MSRHTHKSAAVPFVNQKGERSMKRVKVPRYFAGKRPAYANEEDEEEEYVTDDEGEYDEGEELEDEEEEEEDDYQVASPSRKLDHLGRDSDDEDDDDEDDDKQTKKSPLDRHDKIGDEVASEKLASKHNEHDESEDEDDDPRFRRLKQIEAKTNPAELINVQRTQQIQSRYESAGRNVVLDKDDDEEEVRQRHAIARRRKLEEPLGAQAIFSTSVTGEQHRPSTAGSKNTGELYDDNGGEDDEDEEDYDDDGTRLARKVKRLDTDDILKDLKLTGITRPSRERHKTEAEQEAEQRRLKEALESAKQEAALALQTNKKVEEDIRRELERETLAKGGIVAREMSSAVTDDEDEELAYEEWKFREIKRVQRDRSERLLLLAARAR